MEVNGDKMIFRMSIVSDILRSSCSFSKVFCKKVYQIDTSVVKPVIGA